MLLTGRNNKKLWVVMAYHPSKSNNGHLLVTQQHWRYFTQNNQADNIVQHPRTQFWTNFKPIIQTWIDTGEQIIIGLDVNQQVDHPDVTNYFHALGLTKAILHRHGTDAPPTHQCGSQAIDGIFVTTGLLGHVGGYLSGLAGVIGDHCCLWLDLPEQWIFGSNMPAIVRAGAHRLKSDNPHTWKRYLDNLEKYFNNHLLLQKVQQIETDLLTQQLQPHHKVELECLDTLRIQGMIHAE